MAKIQNDKKVRITTLVMCILFVLVAVYTQGHSTKWGKTIIESLSNQTEQKALASDAALKGNSDDVQSKDALSPPLIGEM